MACIDVHTHFIPGHFPASPGGRSDIPWPSMQHGCGHAHVMISGRKYRTVPDTSWDGQKRAAAASAMRVERQAISPMPELLSYWLPAAEGKVLARHLNDSLAELVASHPERFVGLGTVPLQDVDAAIAELEYVMNTLKLAGVEIATHVGGVSIGDARFRPFFAAAERLGAAIFVHALKPAGMDRLVGPPALEQIVAFPGDVALAIASMMTGGTLEAHEKLRIAFSHSGGAFNSLLPRLQHGWSVVPAIKECMARSPRELAKRLYVDSLTYDEDMLRQSLKNFGTDRVMVGTDYPFAIHEKDPNARLDVLKLDAAARQLVEEGNARRFLGEEAG
jgi:aminocarboxymuconate-semialdehyde decarboxylase